MYPAQEVYKIADTGLALVFHNTIADVDNLP